MAKKGPTPHSTSSPWLKKIGSSKNLSASEKAMAKRLWKKMEKGAVPLKFKKSDPKKMWKKIDG